VPPAPESSYAAEGTLAHAYLDWILKGHNHDAFPQRAQVDDDMNGHVWRTANAIRNAGGRIASDLRVNLSNVYGVEGEFGTLDAANVNGDMLEIHDFKYGKGVEVFPEENEQLMAYALGYLDEIDPFGEITKVRLWIHQPRLRAPDYWDVSIDRLNRFRSEVRLALQAILHGNAELADGDHCRFCDAKPICPKLAKTVSDAVFGAFDSIDTANALPHMEVPAPTILGARFLKIDLIEGWCKAIREFVDRELQMGRRVPGVKLVAGRATPRKWAKEALPGVPNLLKKLGVEPYGEPPLISPTTAERELGKDIYQSAVALYVVSEPGKPVAVPESDKRPAVVLADIAKQFD
jgi:hypothetical protein